MFTRITGDQKRYVEFCKFTIKEDCTMRDAKNSNDYCEVGDALVHLGTFYEEMDTGNPDDTVKQLVKPVKRTCVRIKIEEASLRCLVKKYKRRRKPGAETHVCDQTSVGWAVDCTIKPASEPQRM